MSEPWKPTVILGGERCDNCDNVYSTIYRLPDELWRKATGRNDGGGLLCPVCIDNLLRGLYWEADEGRFPTEGRAPNPLLPLMQELRNTVEARVRYGDARDIPIADLLARTDEAIRQAEEPRPQESQQSAEARVQR